MKVRRRYLWLAAVAILPLLAVGIAWSQRQPIAKSMIDDELAARGVPASYEIVRIGTKRQRLENIVIGNPANPDLTAEWAELDTALGMSGASVKAVRAGGMRLRGKVVKDAVSFGAVDRLLPKPTGEPFTLPDLDVVISDGQLALQTPWGAVGVFAAGKGNLARAFTGKVAVAGPAFSGGGIKAGDAKGLFDVSIKDRTIRFDGPAEFTSLLASGATLGASRLALGGTSNESFTALTLAASGGGKLAAMPSGAAESYRLELAANRALGQPGSANGRIWIEGFRPTGRELAQASAALSGESGTPVEPLVARLRTAIAGLAQGGQAVLGFSCLEGRGCKAQPERFASRSGAVVTGAGQGFAFGGESGLTHSGRYTLGGGGFPDATADLTINGGIWRANAIMKPYAAGGARLALSPVKLTYDRRGLSFQTVATLDGPLGDGRVTGLSLPIAANGGASPLSGCMNPRFERLELAGLRLAPATLRTCISGKQARMSAPRLNGMLGTSPISLAASSAAIGFGKGDFTVENLAVRLSGDSAPTLLDIAELRGRMLAGGATGRYTGVSGRIGAVPLLMSQGAGDWRFSRGVFTTQAALRVADADPNLRFNPLVSNDFTMRFAGDVITAGGILRAPKSGIAVSRVEIRHVLGAGTGQAVLDIDRLSFGQALQPDELTPITLGVIANVSGSVSGRGQIDWTPKGATSSGAFRTDGLDLAAAFGPVTGLSGEIRLSDLLGLETAPGQSVKIAAINPGIAVLDGDVSYQLLPGLKAQIEGGRWPFAGGFLILEPTLLDLNQAAERRLTFRVEGLDMSRFIQAMEFENIAATGTFDGTLPMVFDKDGGRIVGGSLIARGGGTLSYVGEISNEKLGSMAQFAFDALKSIKYNRLSIDLEGAIDGDVITKISFAGVNQAPIQGVRASFPIPIKVTGLNNIPFIFNITITAKFRQLFEMARSFNDPSILINRMIPQLEPEPRDKPKPPPKSVQPLESGPTP